MSRRLFILLSLAQLALTWLGLGQTRLPMTTIIPGTERVQLIPNGDFQLQGPLVQGGHPLPDGWSLNNGEMFADPGTNTLAVHGGVVARAAVGSDSPPSELWRRVVLEPNTGYVLSGYVWNFGDESNHVMAVMDLGDAPNEPQITLDAADPDADDGYFVYRSFTTTDTGRYVTLRIFTTDLVGNGVAGGYAPFGAQWDNLAITKATEFAPPQASGLPGNLSPLVRVENPSNDTIIVVASTPFSLPILASASDPDGAIAKVEFFAGTNRLGEATQSPYSLIWSNAAAGSLQLTAKATDSNGATTLSATVAVEVYATIANLGDTVDPSTMDRKVMLGYQGWFMCPQDGSQLNGWYHWFRGLPVAGQATVDFLPDISELDAEERFATDMTFSNGAPVNVYSAFNRKTVVRHFKWMQDYHLDGVFVQRFVSELSVPDVLPLRNQVTLNVRAGAETYGRVFAVEYDITGASADRLISTLTNDWNYLVNVMQITNSARYLRHRGKPVVGLWGFGLTGRPGSPQDAQTAINFFKSAGLTVMGGVPAYWRTLTQDSQTDPAWAGVYRSFDIINPWTVGRIGTLAEADEFKQNVLIPDLAEATAQGRDYLPVIFPGFSWHNLTGGPLNQIPRQGGNFYWRQTYNAISAGCTMLFGAMFDEVDEGTALFKLAPTPAELPAQGEFVALNADGQALPSDWYLLASDQAGRMLRGETPVQPQLIVTTNTPPVLTLPPSTNHDEATLFSAQATATDVDLPTNALTFARVSGPAGLTVASDGAIHWTPDEAQGPGSYTVAISVTDTNPYAVNVTSLSVTGSFQIVVNEVNVAPVLETPVNRVANPGQVVNFAAAATDVDRPTNTLVFSLLNPPTGASITSGTGVFNWRPLVAQANTTNVIEVRVQDNGSPASSDVKSFTLIVNPLGPVVLTPLSYEGGQFRFAVSGTAGLDYVIAASSNLTQWNDLHTNLSATPPFQFFDLTAGSVSNRVYRVRMQP